MERSAGTGHHRLRGAAVVTAGVTAANLLSYALTLAAARRLGPAEYGALAALLAVLIIGTVPGFAVQAVAALAVVRAEQPDRATVAGQITRMGLLVGAALAAFGLLASPLLSHFLHLAHPTGGLWLAVTLAPLTVTGAAQGVLQGAERFGALAALLVISAAGKVVGGLAGLLLVGDAAGTVAGSAIGTTVAAVAGWWLAGKPRPRRGGWRMAELATAAQALVAIFVLTNTDLVLARHYLPAGEAGLYGVGAAIAKAAFFLPQCVVLVVFPQLGQVERQTRRIRQAAVSLLAVGAILTVASWLAGPLTVWMFGGPSYAALSPDAWLFAAIGGTFAIVQLLVYAQLAHRDYVATLVVWAAIVGEVVLVARFAHHGLTQIAAVALAAGACAALPGAVRTMTPTRATGTSPRGFRAVLAGPVRGTWRRTATGSQPAPRQLPVEEAAQLPVAGHGPGL